jgi:hypothetical protein
MAIFFINRVNAISDGQGVLHLLCTEAFWYGRHGKNLLVWYMRKTKNVIVFQVLYVLRNKSNQVTFLHLYHHISTLLLAWAVATYAPGKEQTLWVKRNHWHLFNTGGHGTLVQLLNTIVHVIMYSYYMIAGLGPRFQRFLWWKKYLTRIQLVKYLSKKYDNDLYYFFPLAVPVCAAVFSQCERA